jgi:hypothetical protein
MTNTKKPSKTPKLTAEDYFLEKWNEFGYGESDITREYKFHPTRRWRFDFAFPSRRTAIEIDGRGRHQTVTGIRADNEKHNTALVHDWAVFHISTSDLRAKDKSGTPLIETFIDMVCLFLYNRGTFDV